MSELNLNFDKEEILRKFAEEDFDFVAKALLNILYDMQRPSIADVLDEDEQDELDEYVETFLHIFTQENFHIPKIYVPLFFKMAGITSNIVAASKFATTDEALEILKTQQNNYAKLLALYSPRNNSEIDLNSLFAAYAPYTSCWWSAVIHASSRCQISYDFDRRLKSYLDPGILEEHFKLPLLGDGSFINENFYGDINYIDYEMDEPIRKIFNKKILENKFYEGLQIDLSDANPKKICVVGRNFHKGNAAYKAMSGLLESLKPDYHLTLASILKNDAILENADTELFDDIVYLGDENRIAMPSWETMETFLSKKFGIIIYLATYPDIVTGILSNLRLAPIQIGCYGNPVRTPEIDYHIGSRPIEPEQPIQYYEEKTVIIPGNAIKASLPSELPEFKQKTDDTIRIACSWGNPKFNSQIVSKLREIYEKSSVKPKFKFIGLSKDMFMHVPFRIDLEKELGEEAIELTESKGFEEYIQDVEACDLGIDSFPFGGYNRVIELLCLGKPCVIIEGDRCFNRLPLGLLDNLGLHELIAKDYDDFVTKTLRLVDDGEYRNSLSEKIKSLDLAAALEDGNEKYFKTAIDYLVENNNLLKESAEKIIDLSNAGEASKTAAQA